MYSTSWISLESISSSISSVSTIPNYYLSSITKPDWSLDLHLPAYYSLIHLPCCSCQLSFQYAILLRHFNFTVHEITANSLIWFLTLSWFAPAYLSHLFLVIPLHLRMLCMKHFQTFTHLFPLPGRLSTLTFNIYLPRFTSNIKCHFLLEAFPDFLD